MGFTVEILSVGNELLIGKTTNTNLTWLSSQLTRIGGDVQRAITVRDDIGEIAEAVGILLNHHPDVIIIGGGLGPTFDDKTMQGLALALDTPLKLDVKARDMINAKVSDLNPARLKMAHIPEKSQPIPNPVGTAPGVRLVSSRSQIIVLPGVPSEMRTMFKRTILRLLKKNFKLERFYQTSFLSTGIPESMIAPYLDEYMTKFQGIYIKSHPLGKEEGRSKINIHITSRKSAAIVARAAETLKEKIRMTGALILPS